MVMETYLGPVLDALPTMAWTALPDGRVDFVNRRWSEYTGLFDAAHGWEWEAAVRPDDLPRMLERWQSILASGESSEMEARVRRFDGQYRCIAIQCSPIRDVAGQVIKWCGVGTDIEDLRRAEEGLKRRELDFQLIVDSIPVPVAVTTPSGKVEGLNHLTLDYFGKTFEELKGWKASDVVHPDDLERTVAAQLEAHQRGSTYNIESRHRRADGVYRWHNVHGLPLRDPQGSILRWLHLLIDIDDRKRTEEALRASDRDASSIVDSIPGMVAAFTPNGELEFVNRQIVEFFGKPFEELRRWATSDMTHPEDLPRAVEYFTRSIASGEPFEDEVRARRFDGVYRWCQSRGFPLRDSNGRIVRWYNLLIDIDERKRAEESLAARERNLNEIINTIPVLAWSALPDGTPEFFNQHYLDYVGLAAGQSEYWDLTAGIHPDDLKGWVATWQAILISGRPGEAEARLRRFDQQYRWFLFRANPLRDESGNIIKWYGISTDIDERKRAEEALLASEREARLIVDSIPGGIEVLSPTGDVEAVNKHVARYFGKTAEELKRTGLAGLIHPEDLQNVLDTARRSTRTGIPFDAEQRFLGADGKYRWFHVRGLPVRDANGRIVRWYALHIDIDDRKRVEEALRESERNFKLTIDTIPTLAWSARLDGSAEFFSQHYLDYVGLSAEQAQGWGWGVTVHPDDLSGLTATWQAIMASGKPGEAEARLRRFDGEYRWLLFRANPLLDASGNIVKWYGVNTDIDDRKRAETNLAREKQLLEMIASGSPLRDVLSALCEMVEEAAFGCYCDVHPIDWSGPTIEYSVAPSLPASYTDPIAGLSLNGDALPCAIAARQKVQVVAEDMDTDPRWHDSSVRTHVLEHGLRSVWSTPIHAKDGRVLGTLCLYQRQPASPSPQHQNLIAHATHLASIAIERSRTEAALRRSETLLAEGQQLSSTGSFSWRVDTDEVAFSEELCRIFEFDPKTVVTLEQVRARVHPEDVPLLSEQMARVRAGHGYLGYDIRLRMPDDRVKYLRTFGRVVRHQDSRLECLAAVQDVTERRLADEALTKARSELAHVSRITSLGALTASIAHEVNQPLSGIITNAGTCLRMLAADPPNMDGARETARRTIRDGNRAADVITRLRALFSKRTASIEPVDLNEAAREVIDLLWSDLQRSRVVLRTAFADGLPVASGDRIQLQQVIVNLLRNAADAMSDVDDRQRRLLIKTEGDEDDHVRLTVQDAGVGIQPEAAERLFEAFYTTKSDGMGIGLSVSRFIIESHNGRLWAASNDGPGATFSFSIPRYSGDEAPAQDVSAARVSAISSAQSVAGI
ncbi:multi-sensor signal transduction histidine kinase [Mesorhizobium alhagi CCNWXJ12-2]|uniref:histidine kinase n=2 Tax=Allomesorhizobium alhagi TaxID=475067 RepID=H0I374_9HYPH|nr:multi-sensor signal transduction histidine kinase [Mesorhizobium alhagi CCNWXJ12-2]